MESILSECLLDKSIGILIVEPTSSIAGSIRRVFLENGYTSVFIAHSVLDAFNTLSNNSIGWIFVSPLLEERLNQWHCLRLPLEVQAFHNIMVSVLVKPEQAAEFEDYYAFGALSIHSRQLTYNSFNQEFGELVQRLREYRTVAEVIAVDVRARFRASESWQKLETFEENFAQKIDSSPAQLLKLIEARLKGSSNLEAMLDMKNALLQHPELAPDLKALSLTYLKTNDIQTFRGKFPLDNVLILDPDASHQQFLNTALTEMGASLITLCETIEQACEALHVTVVYDLIITEWKLNKVEGHAFIQHVRAHGHESQPVIINSTLVKPEDMALISEIRGVFIIPKPMPKKQFKLAMSEVLQRWNFPQEATDQEDKIINCAKSGNLKQAEMLNKEFQANTKIERHRRDFVEAHLAYCDHRFQDAKDLILASVRQGVPKHKEISLLGKILLRLGDPVNALKFLEQANQMVPGNIERMCNLADASSEVGKPERALQLATEARKIGGDIGLVQSVYAKHAVANGIFEEVDELLESEATAREMIAFMNNLGIAHAGAMRWKESEVCYRNALKALKGLHPSLSAMVSYNFGLSLVRQNRLKDALPLLKYSEGKGEQLIKRKALDLRERVEKALSSNQALTLKEVTREVASAADAAPLISTFQAYSEKAKPQAHGLFRVLESQCKALGMDLISDLPKTVTSRDRLVVS